MGFFFTLFLFIATFLLSELLRPKPQQENQRPAGLGDFTFPTATEERVVPLIWGTVKISGPNVVWYGDLVTSAITEKVKTGLFSSSRVTTGFRYYVGIQFALCRGEVDELLRIWIDDKVAWEVGQSGPGTITVNAPTHFGGDDFGNGGVTGECDFLVGTEAQNANSYLSPFQKQGGDTPAYRGTCYLVLKRGYVGNSANIAPWAFELRRIPNGLGLTGGMELVNGNDANPMNVVYELVTNTDWGLAFPDADVDLTAFSEAAEVLYDEGNGFSMVLDRPMEASDFLRELERQIDGVIYLDRLSGKWTVKLARGDYVIGSVPQIDEDDVLEIREFTRGDWRDTQNQVRTNFKSRELEYNGTYGLAQDMANVQIQGGQNRISQVNYPGVKDLDLANQLAWRDLRTLSYPLAKATLAVDRKFFSVNPGDVVAWSDDNLGFSQKAFRVTKLDLGELASGRIILYLTEDVFQFDAAAFTAPPGTGWEDPVTSLVAFPADEQKAFEAPRAFTARDPDELGLEDRVWCGARNQDDGAAAFDIRERNSSGTPSGSFASAGTVYDFFKIGQLVNQVTASAANPTTSILLEPDPDLLDDLLEQFVNVNTSDIGANLKQLILVGDEFMGVDNVIDDDPNVDLRNVWRGLCDTVPGTHAAGTDVFLIFVGGGLTETVFPAGNNVDIKLIPRSPTAELAEGSATTISLTLANRARRPYPPSEPTYNGTRYASSVSLDVQNGSTLDDRGITLVFNRRDFRTLKEILSILNDAADIVTDFPAANTTEYQWEVRNDPDGANTLLFTTAWDPSNDELISRTKILRNTDGALPTRMRIVIKTRHVYEGTTYEARVTLPHDFNVTTALTGQFNLTALDTNEVSPVYSAPATGTYAFSLGVGLASGAVEARLNGGSWTTVVTAGSTSGNLVGVTAGDDIEIRHTQATGTLETILLVDAPSGQDAYGVLFT